MTPHSASQRSALRPIYMQDDSQKAQRRDCKRVKGDTLRHREGTQSRAAAPQTGGEVMMDDHRIASLFSEKLHSVISVPVINVFKKAQQERNC